MNHRDVVQFSTLFIHALCFQSQKDQGRRNIGRFLSFLLRMQRFNEKQQCHFQQPTMSCVFRITSRTTEPIVREFAKHVFKRHEPDIAVRVDVDSQAPPSTRSLSAAVTRLPAGFWTSSARSGIWRTGAHAYLMVCLKSESISVPRILQNWLFSELRKINIW